MFASQVKQVFYVEVNDVNHTWSVIVQGKRRILSNKGIVNEEENDKFDEAPLLSIGVQPLSCVGDFDTIYMHQDLDENDDHCSIVTIRTYNKHVVLSKSFNSYFVYSMCLEWYRDMDGNHSYSIFFSKKYAK